MKIHRFVGATAREALGLVREALGPDAMIMSNRSVDDGVEILACSEQDLSTMIEGNENAVPPSPRPSEPQPVGGEMHVVMDELRAMRGALETQLAWNGQRQRSPTKAGILKELLSMGFSVGLARQLTEGVPADLDVEQGLAWARRFLAGELAVMRSEDELLQDGGVYALIGPTGVGKTTTTAKLAARCVMRYGPGKLALITTDSYRIGAHEQLRIYGQILGVMVHSVKDEQALQIALDDLRSKHTILIDTVGMSQRDQMVAEHIAMLSDTPVPVKRLLCLSSTSTIETLNEVVEAYRGSGLDGCIITKIDEAATLSNVLDVMVRHRLRLCYVAMGQRVPEDLQLADATTLVERAFQHRKSASATRYKDSELPAVMAAAATEVMRTEAQLRGHHAG